MEFAFVVHWSTKLCGEDKCPETRNRIAQTILLNKRLNKLIKTL